MQSLEVQIPSGTLAGVGNYSVSVEVCEGALPTMHGPPNHLFETDTRDINTIYQKKQNKPEAHVEERGRRGGRGRRGEGRGREKNDHHR